MSDVPSFEFTGTLWRWESQPAVRMVTVPADVSEVVRLVAGPPRGFGSVRVDARIGTTVWRTSIFPFGPEIFALPLKLAVRKAQDIEDGDTVTVVISIVDAAVEG